ncbi:hypothetical protein [Fredinandcohnia sp. 179-A 10B2 NHS]|uniref:hypothetical protein n=1 Tax=Fredinandcohnia sp. 179-A 10B2 NHS TaxID=3235176 RepID=UPI0039A3041D
MSKFDKELDRFVSDYYKDHDEAKGKLDKWASKNEEGLKKLDQQSASFERDIEARFDQLDKWLAKQQHEHEKTFGK